MYYSCILLCWGPPTVPRSRSFFLSLVLDRHDYRVKACVHRRNTGRTSRIATLLTLLSVGACFQGSYFVSFILAGGDTAKMEHFVISADY